MSAAFRASLPRLMATVDGPLHAAANTATQGFRLQPASAVAARVAASHLVHTRWTLENILTEAARPEISDAIAAQAKDAAAKANEALMASAHLLEFTPVETKFLNQPLGSVADGQAEATAAFVEHYGRWESFGVLLWSLGLIPSVPAHTHRFDYAQLIESVGVNTENVESTARFLSRDHILWPESHLVAELNKTEAWYWRSRIQSLLLYKKAIEDPSCDTKDKLSKMPKAVQDRALDMTNKIDVAILFGTCRGSRQGLIEQAVGDDFGIPDTAQAGKGIAWKRYVDGSETEWTTMRLIAENRLAAFGWLMAGREWDVNRQDLRFVTRMSGSWYEQ